MSDRITINSASLQARFPQIYKEFFSGNDLVISGSMTYVLQLSSLAWRIGSPLIAQKLPFKAYVGVRRNGSYNKFTIGTQVMYSPASQIFCPIDYEIFKWSKVESYLQAYCKQQLNTSEFPGLEFSFLLEHPEHLSFDASFSMMIMNALSFYFGLISGEELSKMVNLSMRETKDDSDVLFRKYKNLHRAAMNLMAASGIPATSGSTIYFNFVDSEYPLIHFLETTYHTQYPDKLQEVLNHPADAPYTRQSWWGFRLNEIADISGGFPLDVAGITFSSGSEMIPYYDYADKTVLPLFSELQEYIKDRFRMIVNENNLPPFLQDIGQDGVFWRYYAQGQMITDLFLIWQIIRLYQHRFSDKVIGEFFDTLNALNYSGVPPLLAPSAQSEYILSELVRRAAKKNISIGARIISEDRRPDTILVFSRSHQFRRDIEAFVKELKDNYDSTANLNFISWRDGWGKDGLRIEQFISKGMISSFIDSDSLILFSWNKNGEFKQMRVMRKRDIENINLDFIIDAIHGKIFVKGKECHSEELPTQKATAEIMAALLESKNHRVNNKNLPDSAYTRYRNELQGKIVSPLVALVKKRLNRELFLKIEGSLTDFHLSFDPKGFTIGIIKKT